MQVEIIHSLQKCEHSLITRVFFFSFSFWYDVDFSHCKVSMRFLSMAWVLHREGK